MEFFNSTVESFQSFENGFEIFRFSAEKEKKKIFLEINN